MTPSLTRPKQANQQKKTAKRNQQFKIIKEKIKKVTDHIDSILFGKQSE